MRRWAHLERDEPQTALLSIYKPRESGLPTWPPEYLKWRGR